MQDNDNVQQARSPEEDLIQTVDYEDPSLRQTLVAVSDAILANNASAVNPRYVLVDYQGVPVPQLQAGTRDTLLDAAWRLTRAETVYSHDITVQPSMGHQWLTLGEIDAIATTQLYIGGIDIAGISTRLDELEAQVAPAVAETPALVNPPPAARGTGYDTETGVVSTYATKPPRIPVGVDAVAMDVVYRFFELMGEALRPFMTHEISGVALPAKWGGEQLRKYQRDCTATFTMDDCTLSVPLVMYGPYDLSELFLTGTDTRATQSADVRPIIPYIPASSASLTNTICTTSVHLRTRRVEVRGFTPLLISTGTRDASTIVRNPRTGGESIVYSHARGTASCVRNLSHYFAWRVPNVLAHVQTACLLSMRLTTSRLIAQAKAGKASPIRKSSTLPVLVPPALPDATVQIVEDILFAAARKVLAIRTQRMYLAHRVVRDDLDVLFTAGPFSPADDVHVRDSPMNRLSERLSDELAMKPLYGVAMLPSISPTRGERATIRRHEKILAVLTEAGKGTNIRTFREIHRILVGVGGV